MEYKFTTRSVFLLGQFLSCFEKHLDELIEILACLDGMKPGEDVLSRVPMEKVMSVVVKVVGSASQAENLAVQLLAVGSDRSIAQVQELDGYMFLSEFKAYLMSINWRKLLGESLGLTLAAPELPSSPISPNPPMSSSETLSV